MKNSELDMYWSVYSLLKQYESGGFDAEALAKEIVKSLNPETRNNEEENVSG